MRDNTGYDPDVHIKFPTMHPPSKNTVLAVVTVILCGAIGYVIYSLVLINNNITSLQDDVDNISSSQLRGSDLQSISNRLDAIERNTEYTYR